MSLVKRRSGYFKNSPWFNKLPRLVEGPPFGEGLSLSEKMYAQKFEKSESGWSLCNLKYAAYAMQGFRKHMQDDYQCVPNYTIGSEREPCASFAVYDGHGLRGHGVSSFCADTFLGSVYGRKAIHTAKHVTTELMKANIHKTFVKFDQQLREDQVVFSVPGVASSSQLPLQYSGTTVTSVFISDEDIIFANLGDSRTILCRNNKLHFETKDHSPAVDDEAKRVKAAGGRVHTNPNKHTVIMDPDVDGNCDFAVSRAVGDFAFKIPTDKQPEEYMVSPIPDIHEIQRDYQADQFLLLASDGIFKSLSSEQVMRFILKRLQCTTDITGICRDLILTAYYSYDNIPDDTTVVLIVFPAAPEVNSSVLKQEEVSHKQALKEMEKELRVLVRNSEDVRVLDNEFSIFLDLVNKLPPEYKVQLKMDYFRETLDALRVERYGSRFSKKFTRASMIRFSHSTSEKASDQEQSQDSCNGGTKKAVVLSGGIEGSWTVVNGSDHTTQILHQNSDSPCTHQTGPQDNNIMQSTDETSNGTVNADKEQVSPQQVES